MAHRVIRARPAKRFARRADAERRSYRSAPLDPRAFYSGGLKTEAPRLCGRLPVWGGLRQSYSRRFSLRDFFKMRGSKEQSKATLLDPILAVGPTVFEYTEAVRVTPVDGPCATSLRSRRLLRGCECGRFQSCGSAWGTSNTFSFTASNPER